MSDVHQFLPWFVNGTLAPDETAAFESHLPACAACRRELELMTALFGDGSTDSAAILGDHPSPEHLLAAADPGQTEEPLAEERAAEIEQHIGLCVFCAEEVRWLKGAAAAAEAQDPRRTLAPGWIAWLGWAVAAAAVVMLVLIPTDRRSGTNGKATGVPPIGLIRSTQRESGSLSQVLVPPGAASIQLFFEADLADADFPVILEVASAGGKIVFRSGELDPSDLLAGAAVPLACDRSDCPDGAYTARLITRDPAGSPVLYAFNLATDPSPR